MEDLLLQLKKHGITIKVEGTSLKLNIPKDIDATDIISKVKDNKEELIAYISKRMQLNNTLHSIEKAAESACYRLSSAQKRVYFLHEFDKMSLAYNIQQVVRLEGHIERGKFEHVFKRLIERHESLRTSFHIVNEEPMQKINAHVNFNIEHFKNT